MTEIRFYRVGDDYGNFSNFAPFPIFIANTSWPTVEHYFQACKFENSSIREKIRSLSSPMSAANEGRKRNHPLRVDWENVKDNLMLEALHAKFKQHPSLRKELLLTGEAILVENTGNDSYWGNGGDGRGKNMLGKLLVEVRTELKSINSDLDTILPPWLSFPEIDQSDMFWRMGLGENYMYLWSKYYLALEDKLNYHQNFPEPENWLGFFD